MHGTPYYYIATDGSDASGVVMGQNLVLTAAHVVDSEGRALVYIHQQYRFADIIAVDAAAANRGMTIRQLRAGRSSPWPRSTSSQPW